MIKDWYLIRGLKRALGLHTPGRMLDVFPEDTFLVSYPKSGNTWIRFLIANLKYPEKHPDFTNINELVPDPGAHSKRTLNRLPRPRTLKSHQYFDPRYRKVLYIVRDPRDVVLAEYHFGIKQRLHGEDYPLAQYVSRFLAGDTAIPLGVGLTTWPVGTSLAATIPISAGSIRVAALSPVRASEDCQIPGCSRRSRKAYLRRRTEQQEWLRELEKTQAHLFSATRETRLDCPTSG